MRRLLHFLSHSSLLLLARFVTEQLFEFYIHGGGKKVSSDRGKLWRWSERNLVLKQRQTLPYFLQRFFFCAPLASPDDDDADVTGSPRASLASPECPTGPASKIVKGAAGSRARSQEPRLYLPKTFPPNFTKHFPQNLLLNSLYVQCNIFMTWWWKRVWRYDDRMMMLVMIEWWSYADVSDD